MEGFDAKDRQILGELVVDARQTNSAIAKKLNLSREVVQYRIARLEKIGVVKKYISLVDSASLGYITFHAYVRLQDFDEAVEQEIVNSIAKNKHIKWLVSLSGQYDLFLVMVARTRKSFDEQLRKLLSPHSKYIAGTMILNSYALVKPYMFPGQKSKIVSGEETLEKDSAEIRNLESVDLEILDIISSEARMNVVEVASRLKKRKLSLTPEAVSYRIKKLRREGIIRGYQAVIDFGKLEYLWYVLLFNLRTISSEVEMKLKETLSRDEFVLYSDKTLGSWNLRMELLVKNHEEFHHQLVRLRKLFSGYLNKYELMIIFDDYATCSFTKGMYEELKLINKK